MTKVLKKVEIDPDDGLLVGIKQDGEALASLVPDDHDETDWPWSRSHGARRHSSRSLRLCPKKMHSLCQPRI